MYGFLLTILVLDGLLLSVVVLLQAGKGGGLASVGGGTAMTEGILGGRQATTMLTRATWTTGTIFMVLALWLSILSSRSQQPTSVIQVPTPAASTAPAPVLPGAGPPAPSAGTGAPGQAPAPLVPPS